LWVRRWLSRSTAIQPWTQSRRRGLPMGDGSPTRTAPAATVPSG
jgi:hypothetical protein